MREIVLSGINLFEGGPLSIYYDCLDCLVECEIYKEYNILAFVHKKELFAKYADKIEFIELPDSRNSYLKRLWYEYFYFYRFSKKEDIDIWISLHDITPRVKANKLYTYCHNPTPFMKTDLSKVKYSVKNVAFSLFYKYLYRINIKAADAIIVQQDWMRKEFLRLYPIQNVIVARPSVSNGYKAKEVKKETDKKIFVFVSYPRYYKNFEVICQAVKEIDRNDFEVWLTLDGSENKYASDLVHLYSNIKRIKWIGLQSREKIFEIYDIADYMIFPSTLETWGLPISEFKLTNKPLILADLPYAHETLGNYEKALFFDPYNYKDLAEKVSMVLTKQSDAFSSHHEIIPNEPYASNWRELILKFIVNLEN